MSKKIDIREIHKSFENLLFQRNSLIESDPTSNKIDQLDMELLTIIKSGIDSEIAFSEVMNEWTPISSTLLSSIDNDLIINVDDEQITLREAWVRKLDKEKKFKGVQNISMLACTALLILYYVIVGWWI